MIIKGFPSFRFESKEIESHILTNVYMDGKQLQGVTAADISFGIDQIPVVHLTLLAGEVIGDIKISEVTKDG